LCDVGRVAVKHCFKLLSFFTFITHKRALGGDVIVDITDYVSNMVFSSEYGTEYNIGIKI